MELSLLGGFKLTDEGRVIDVPEGAQRLLAFLGLSRTSALRAKVAGTLWPDATDKQSMGSLRSTLWRLQGSGYRAIDVKPATLTLAIEVSVDFEDAIALAQLLISDTAEIDGDHATWVDLFSSDLLPEWYEDWTQGEAERWRQLRLHALEAVARRLRDQGRYPDALAAALAAVSVDPLRETAHRELIKVHLAEGNPSEAIRAFDRYCHRLFEELGLEPSQELRELVSAHSRTGAEHPHYVL
ncbi:MAG: hypothetical protein QOG04_1477 [Actinomycetota bacterium]|jgi:DNA-binding SARP family transcriptional activator|nr:hypothetical protein [Actinomycetota bacterium]